MYGRDVQADGVDFDIAYCYVVQSLFTGQTTQINPILKMEKIATQGFEQKPQE